MGEAVEVERTAVGVHEVLLAGAVDGVAETEFDGTARDIGGAAVVLSVVKQQGTRTHLGEVRTHDDLAGQVDGHAVHDLEVASVSHGGGSELKSGDRQRVGDGRRTGGASEEEVAGGEAERGERGPGDVARVRIGHSERVQGRTHQAEIVARRGRGDLSGGGRHEHGVGEGRGGGVIREGDDGGTGGRRDGEGLGRGRGGGRGAEDEGGAVCDGSDRRAGRDVRPDDLHAGDESGGAGDGDRGAGVGGRPGEQVDGARVSGEVVAGDADATFDPADEISVDGRQTEVDLIADAEAGDAVEIEDGGGVIEGYRRERQDVGTGTRHQDTARAFADRQGASRFGRAGAVSDQAEESVVLKGNKASGNTTTADVTSGVIEGEFALIADEDTEAADGTDGKERARAADDSSAAVHAQLTPEGVGGGEIERARATIIERATGGGAAVDDDRGEVSHPRTAVDEDAVVGVVGKVDATLEGQRVTRAGDVVEEVAVTVPIDEITADFDRGAADELGVLTIEEELVRDLVRAGQDDAVAAHGAAFELEGARTEGAGLGKAEVALVKDNAAGKGVDRGTGQLEDRAVGDRDAQAGGSVGRRIRDLSVPDGLRARSTDVEDARVGVVLPVDVVAVDRQDRSVFEVVRERAVIAAGEFVDVGVDGDRIDARETGARVVIDEDRLGDGQARRIRREDGPVGHEDAAEDDIATQDHRAVAVDRESGAARDTGDGVGKAEAVTADVGADLETGGGTRLQRDSVGSRGRGGAAGAGLEPHRGRRSEAEGTTVDAGRTGVSVSAGQHPDALVRLVDAERLRGVRVGEDGRDGVEVGIDAAEFQHAFVARTEGGQRGARVGVDDVRQGQRTRAAGLDTAGTGGASDVDRTGRDFARTSVGQGDGIAAARVTELEPAARDVGTKGRGSGAGGADGGNDELLVTQDRVARVGIEVAQDERTAALLGDITRAGDDARDRGEVQAGETIVANADIAPSGAAEGERTGAENEISRTRGGRIRAQDESRSIGDGGDSGSTGDTRTRDRHAHHEPSSSANGDVGGPGRRGTLADALVEVELITGIVTHDVGIGQNARATHQLADRDGGKVSGGERLGSAADNGGSESIHHGGRTDLKVASDFDLSQRIAGVEREGGTLQEAGAAIGIPPDQPLARPVDDELGAVGGETGETGVGSSLPLIGARANGAVKGAGRLEERAPSPVLRELQIGSGRQGSTVDGDERAPLDNGRAGVSVRLVTERPESTITRARDRQGAAERVVDEAEIDLVVAGGIAAEVQRAAAGPEVGDIAGVREDERGLVIRTTQDIETVGTVRLDRGVAGQGEEAVDRDGRRLRRLEDIDVTVVVVGLGRVARVEQGAAIEDERPGVVGDVAATDGRDLADIGERADGQGAATDDGGAGVIIQAGEGLGTGAVLDDGDSSGGLVDQAVEGPARGAVDQGDDGGRGVGINDGARADEGPDRDTGRSAHARPIRTRGAGSVEIEGRALTEIQEGRTGLSGADGGRAAGKSQGAGVDVDAAGEGIGTSDDEETRASLGERTSSTRDQVIDGQRVSGRRAVGRDDDFRGGSAEGTRTGDGGGTGAIIKEHTARAVGEESVERKGLGTSQFERVHSLGAGDRQVGGGEIVSRRGEAGGRKCCIRRERTRSRTADEPVDAAEGGPTADDAVGTGRTGREGEGPAGDRREIKGGAGTAGTEGSEGQHRRTTGSSDGLNGTMASRRREGSDGLRVHRAQSAFVTQDATCGVAEGIDIEDDGGVRQDIAVGSAFAELEHTVGNGGRAGQGKGIIGGGRVHPGARAHLLQAGDIGAAVIQDDRGDDVIGRVRAAEAEGLRGRAGSDRAGNRQRAGAVGDEHRDGVSPNSEEIEAGRKGGGRPSIDQGAGTIVVRIITPETDFRHSTEGAHTGDLHGALQDIENSPQVASRALEGEVTNAFLLEGVSHGTSLEDAAGDEGVTVTVKAQDACGAVALTPKVGVERQETVTFVADTGFIATTAADEVIESGERGAETVTAVEDDAGVAAVRVEVAELEDAPDGGAAQTVVDEDPTVGVIADEDILLGEAVEDVAADFERAVVDVDRQATGVQAERAGGGDADGAVIDTDPGGEGVLIVLQPQGRAVDHADLDDTVLRVVVIIDPTGDDGVTATEEEQGVAGTEVHIAREGGDAGNGSEAGLAPASAAEADGAGESIVADGDQRAGSVVGARATAAGADDTIEGQSGDRIRSLHDERTAGETRITRAGHAGDGDGANTRAQLGRIGDDEGAGLDEDPAVQRVGIVGQDQRAVARLDEAGGAGQLRVDRHARTEVDAQRGRIDTDRHGQR